MVDTQLSGIEGLGVGSIVNRLYHWFEALKATLPDPVVLLADFELALFGFVQANVARRFFVIGKFPAAIEVDVFEIIFGIPLPGSSFDLLLKANGFGVGEVVLL